MEVRQDSLLPTLSVRSILLMRLLGLSSIELAQSRSAVARVCDACKYIHFLDLVNNCQFLKELM
jgi:hypothetical protein